MKPILVLFLLLVPLLTWPQEFEPADIHYSLSPIHSNQKSEFIQQVTVKLRMPFVAGKKNDFC
ncbi:hypothetical protein [Xanthocytophaga agilis]|uniref:Uncharacterized protein n=1 Tax=Xanthocytophaga agilis TaxID=3048010 RepID=A0AAE3R7N0_9BACT|nr:hypothetical protein [Xanthocytophaga agilis]MDJ1505346.1 hypothetical protein [Xanthocytophaga agilis]